MILVYNFLLTFFCLILLPLLIPVVLVRKKYRGRTLERLGFQCGRIKKQRAGRSAKGPTIWIHALSVGEVTSALPLVKAIRDDMDGVAIIFTAATRSGKQLADTIIAPHVDLICYSPFDLWFAVQRYIAAIQPDLFILVETDFWPNWLWLLNRKKIPALLVNGRISEKSFALYSRFSFIFKPMFQHFNLLSMQTAADADKMIDLGINANQVLTLGNLKYDMETTGSPASEINRQTLGIAENQKIWVCGSTHAGEERILLATFARLAVETDLFLILAPRDIGRADELTDLAREYSLHPKTRTDSQRKGSSNVLILDTIGELASCYLLAHLAFVGGSLVPRGGHNPIEPAACEVPVLFGSHMDDFSEIAHDLITCGGAETVTAETLVRAASGILTHPALHAAMAGSAGDLVRQHRGGMSRHLQAIHHLLGS
jgi:3-deoxy-D-manno-octulosonic-acid transferase